MADVASHEALAAAREARRRSRWSTNRAFVPGMPTILPSDMDDVQQQVYLRKHLLQLFISLIVFIFSPF